MKFGYDKTSRLFLANLNAEKRIVVNQGGTSSGKTYSILQVLIIKAIQAPNQTITVVGESIPNLKRGSYRDFETICGNELWVNDFIRSWNKTERTVTFITGSQIEFTSYETAQSAKNGKRHYSFLNEANGISYDIAEEIMLRTTHQIFIDYNPSAEFWLHERILPMDRDKYTFIKSTWRHNPFVSDSVRDKILSYEHTDPYRWQVYGLGELGKLEGLVYPNWIEADAMPEDWDWEIYGLDFGYTNDPTACVRIRKNGRRLYLQTVFYEIGLTNREISARLHTVGIKDNDLIYADSAEPKTIADLRRGFPDMGLQPLTVLPALKGPDSIDSGISKMKEFEVCHLRSDAILRKEVTNYQWVQIEGKSTNKPVDKWNHALDAGRYAVYTHTFRNR